MSSEQVPSYPVNEDGWPLSPEGFELVEEIGQGAFAKVIKTHCPSKGCFVAVKIMALENITTSMEEIQSEVKAMKLNRHENVLDLYCCFVVGSDLWLVMPLMDKGSCYYMLRCLRKSGRIQEGQGLPEDVIATIIRELLQGLEYIHAQGQIHRDIKAGNILLNSEGRVAIADFGVAGWMTETGSRADTERKTFVGTPCWMAPEVMEQMRGYNEKADIWSVGITALELAKGYAPYSRYAPMQVLIKTIREPPPSIKSYVDPPGVPPTVLSDRFHKFVARCLQKDPKQRASAHDLVSDPFIKRGLKTPRMVEMLLKDIPTVGGKGLQSGGGPGGQDADGKPAGYGKLSLRSSGDDDGTGADGGVSLVPGTTWIFPDELKEQLGIGQYSNNYAGGGGMGLGAGAGVDYSNSSLGASGIAPGPDGPAYHDGALDGSLSGAGDGSGVGDGTAGGVGGGGMLHHHLSHSSHHELGGMVYGDEGEEDTSLDALAAELEALGGENVHNEDGDGL